MKILFLGAGAVGGYWAARLHQSGADVTLLLREKRAETVRKNGLVVKSPKGDAVVPANVVEGVRPILHLKFFHPANDHYGLSPLEAAARAIDSHGLSGIVIHHGNARAAGWPSA